MARSIVKFLGVIAMVFSSCLCVNAQDSIRVAGFDLPYANSKDIIFESDVTLRLFENPSCEFGSDSTDHAQPVESAPLTLRKPNRLMSHSSYSCPFQSCTGQDITPRMEKANSDSREESLYPSVEPVDARLKKTDSNQLAFNRATLGWGDIGSALKRFAPLELQLVESGYRFVTAPSDQFVISLDEKAGKLPTTPPSNSVQDAYWKYYSDCDRWGIVFQSPPESAISPSIVPTNTSDDSLTPAEEGEIFGTPDVAASDDSTVPSFSGFSTLTHFGIWMSMGGQGLEQLSGGMTKIYRTIEFRMVESAELLSDYRRPTPIIAHFVVANLYAELDQIRGLDGGLTEWLENQRQSILLRMIDSPVLPFFEKVSRNYAIVSAQLDRQLKREKQALGSYVAPRLNWIGSQMQNVAQRIEESFVEKTAESEENGLELK